MEKRSPDISIIAAVSENRVIGNGSEIPWHIPGEQKRFKELTTGNTIIMGRKTYDSIGKALPDRTTIVMSRDKNLTLPDCTVVNSLEEALDLTSKEPEIFIAGGAEIYQLFMPLTTTIYLTIVKIKVHGNKYFPKIGADFVAVYSEEKNGTIPYVYKTLKRNI